jgi:sugar lactone lactonase YvrE
VTLAAPVPLEYRRATPWAGRGNGPGQFRSALRGIAVGAAGIVFAAGDSIVKVFDSAGVLVREWPTERSGFCVASDDRERVWVGELSQVEVFAMDGERLEVRKDPPRLGRVTAVGFAGEDAFFADATARCIHRYDGAGVFLNAIGDKHRKGGFHIPNGVVDFAIDEEDVIHVANPGMHRVERYSVDGGQLGRFGHFDGRDPAGFSGCCNPTNVTVDARGRVIVTEKAGPRAKVYGPDGVLITVVARDVFDPGAKNMDVVVDRTGRIYVVDTVSLEIQVFEPLLRDEAA